MLLLAKLAFKMCLTCTKESLELRLVISIIEMKSDLRNNGDGLPQAGQVDALDVLAGDEYLPRLRLEEAEQHAHHGRLAATKGCERPGGKPGIMQKQGRSTHPLPEPPTMPIFLPGGMLKFSPVKMGLPLMYLKLTSRNSISAVAADTCNAGALAFSCGQPSALQPLCSGQTRSESGDGSDLDPGLHRHERKHGLHVDERLPHFAVHRAQETQRDRQLEQQPVHHHQVAHCHMAWRRTTGS